MYFFHLKNNQQKLTKKQKSEIEKTLKIKNWNISPEEISKLVKRLDMTRNACLSYIRVLRKKNGTFVNPYTYFSAAEKKFLEKCFAEDVSLDNERLDKICEDLKNEFPEAKVGPSRITNWWQSHQRTRNVFAADSKREDSGLSNKYPTQIKYTDEQREILIAHFEIQNYVTTAEATELGKKIGKPGYPIPPQKIMKFFQGRRTKLGIRSNNPIQPFSNQSENKSKPKPFKFTEHQNNILQHHYSIKNNRWSYAKSVEIADETNLSVKAVRDWLSRERRKRNESPLVNNKRYTDIQREKLIFYFNKQDDTPLLYCEMVSKEVGIPAKNILNWFRHRRGKINAKNKPKSSNHPPMLYNGNHPLNEECLEILNGAYAKNNHPTRAAIEKLSMVSGLGVKNVILWFSHERTKRGENISAENRNGMLTADSIYEDEVYRKLRKEFEKDPFPDYSEIADDLGLTVQQVQGWFARERHKKRNLINKIL